MKKKTLIIILMVFLLVGCGSGKSKNEDSKGNNNAKKEEYANTLKEYLAGARNLVNEAGKLRFYEIDTVYLIPFGHDSSKSCVSLEKGGKSPFDNKWNYAYVAAFYNGREYRYYLIAEDGKGYWTNTTYDLLEKNGKEEITDPTDDKLEGYEVLENYYNFEDENTVFSSVKNSTDYKKLLKVVAEDEGYDKIVIIGADECKYYPTNS